MAERKKLAWELYNSRFTEPKTVEETIDTIGADFEVVKAPLIALPPSLVTRMMNGDDINGDELRKLMVSEKVATMRTDKNISLGVVGKDYGVVQNKEAFQFIDTLTSGELRSGNPIIETAGVMGDGQQMFITAKFPEPILLGGNHDDPIDMHIVFRTSHDGSGAVTAAITPIRVWCNNQLNIAFKECVGRISYRHTSRIMERMDIVANKENRENAYRTLQIYDTYKKVLQEKLNHLAKLKFESEQQLQNILAEVILTKDSFESYKHGGFKIEGNDGMSTIAKNTLSKAMETMYVGVGQQPLERGTALWAVNGLTSLYQNEVDYKTADKKLKSILDGRAQQNLQKLYEKVSLLEAV